MLPQGYEVSTDPTRIDLDYVHRYLSQQSYWAGAVPRDVVARSVANALSFGLYAPDGAQVGFARVVTDRATFAWLADVFIDPGRQGLGLGKGLMDAIIAHPDLQGLRRFMLATADAHGLYERYGFTAVEHPERLMVKLRTDLYPRS
ncbi:GNAT family N-acetyltransferase [Devosia sp. LjRoot16]|jgi:GNAT superfamily N-acetyltransferase|uniref:GNAT family N-acetyltransferase n=1 Tax=Devosia sp. LjRoot16 TaxID=3342271 RepID=UPI003ECC4628